MNVLLLGATGLVGGKLLELILNDPDVEKVCVISRRTCGKTHAKLKEIISPLEEMHNYQAEFNVDSVLCCLGSTIKKAGSKENFRTIDLEYPLKAAKLSKKAGAKRYGVITAMGSNAKSMFFYNQVKGNLENKLKELQLKELFIVRPSLIIGERQESRFGEGVAIKFYCLLEPLTPRILKKYLGSQVEDIAELMLALSKGEDKKSTVDYEKLNFIHD